MRWMREHWPWPRREDTTHATLAAAIDAQATARELRGQVERLTQPDNYVDRVSREWGRS